MNPLEELRQLETAVGAANDLEALRPVFYRLESISREQPNDPDVQALCARVKEHLVRRANAFRAAAQPDAAPTPPATSEPPPAATPLPTPPPSSATASTQPEMPVPPLLNSDMPAAPPPPVMPAVGARTKPPAGPPPRTTPPRPPAKPAGKPNVALTLGIGAVVGIVLFGAALWFYLQKVEKSSSGPAAGTIPVRIISDPPGAFIRVDDKVVGKSPVDTSLSEGSHEVSALLDGYSMVSQTVRADKNLTHTLTFTLQPQQQSVAIYTDLQTGKVTLDGKPTGDLVEGQFLLPDASPGSHELAVTGAQGSLAVSFEVKPGSAPVLKGPVQAKDALGVVIAGGREGTRLYSSGANLAVSEAGQALGTCGADGLDLSRLPAGDHTLTLGAGNDAKSVVVNIGTSPRLVAFLKRDLEAGTLVVVTGEDDATVFLNGRAMTRKTRGGRLRIPFLNVRSYRVKIQKDGFEPSAEQTAEVRKGEETKVAFELVPLVSTATLEARGLPEGTEVWTGGQKIATVHSDGQLKVTVDAGERDIELRKEGYEHLKIHKQFPRGGTVELASSETAMKATLAKVTLVRSPANSDVRIKRQDESAFRQVRESELTLPAGTYTFIASAPDHQQRTETIRLAEGAPKTVDLTLAKIEAPKGPPSGLEGFEDIAKWQRGSDWSVRAGGGFSLFSPQPLRGTVVFTANRRKGKELNLVFNYQNERNYLMYTLDDKGYRLVEFRDGKRRDVKKDKYQITNPTYLTLSAEVSPNFVVLRFFEGNQWKPLDTYEDRNHNLTEGRFGFYLPGTNEIGVRNFRFTAVR